MARSTPPSLISYTEVAYNTVTNPIVSASVSWQTGDVVVVISACENANTQGTPTATGLTFTQQQANATAGTCATKGSTAIAASNGSSAISVSSLNETGMGVWVWRGSDGVGTSTEQHTSTKSKSMTPTDTHSAFCWTVADFDAQAATATIIPTPTNTREAAQQASHYTVYSADLVDQASAGATTFGISGGVGTTGPYSLVVQEILGTGSAVVLPPLVMAPQRR